VRTSMTSIVALLLSMAFTLLAVRDHELATVVAVPAFIVIGGFLILSSCHSKRARQ